VAGQQVWPAPAKASLPTFLRSLNDGIKNRFPAWRTAGKNRDPPEIACPHRETAVVEIALNMPPVIVQAPHGDSHNLGSGICLVEPETGRGHLHGHRAKR